MDQVTKAKSMGIKSVGILRREEMSDDDIKGISVLTPLNLGRPKKILFISGSLTDPAQKGPSLKLFYQNF